MKDKTILITGATNGIGKATAIHLAQQGHRVVIVGRNPTKTEATLQEIRSASGNDAVHSLLADLTVQSQVRQLAEDFKRDYERLDVLINNAGTIYNKYGKSTDGIEQSVALNHMAYFVLTCELLDMLAETGTSDQNARIINTSSSGHRMGARSLFSNFQGEHGYNGFVAYCRTKLANVLFTYALAHRIKDHPITVNTWNPGTVNTAPGISDTMLVRFFQVFNPGFMVEPEIGSSTAVYLATSPDVEGMSGHYFHKGKSVASSRFSQEEANQERLWDMTEDLMVEI
ncbi:SDR family NAD(P)-dependent oxidoreductase [bacterium]|nr:SDR family NAD(P)-dependent oxidoreductase [bacterium]